VREEQHSIGSLQVLGGSSGSPRAALQRAGANIAAKSTDNTKKEYKTNTKVMLYQYLVVV